LRCALGRLAKKFGDAGFGAADDGFVSFDDDGALEELFVFDEDVDNGLWFVDEVVWVEFEFFEFGVFADEVFDGVFKGGDELGEGGFVGWGFDVEDDFVIYSEFFGDRQGIV